MRPRDDELTYLRRVELLAHSVCEHAFAEGRLSFGPDPDGSSALERAVNELGRNLRYQHSEGDGCCD